MHFITASGALSSHWTVAHGEPVLSVALDPEHRVQLDRAQLRRLSTLLALAQEVAAAEGFDAALEHGSVEVSS